MTSATRGKGGSQKLTFADGGGGGSENAKILLTSYICERSLIVGFFRKVLGEVRRGRIRPAAQVL